MNNRPIGVFDSGIGGLTVLKELFRVLGSESTVYLGDTARVPYGIRSAETVTRYAFENAAFLVDRGIKLLIVACNTASAVSLEAIQVRFPIPVIGVIEPGARAAVRATRERRVGVIGTEATINSSAYARAIRRIDPGIDVFGAPCPLFVPLAEEGVTDDEVATLVAERYLRQMKEHSVDTLVLGCTHYPLLRGVIGRVMGPAVTLIDSAVETVREVRETLVRDGMEAPGSGEPWRLFYVTDSPERFRRVGERFLGDEIRDIEKVDIGL